MAHSWVDILLNISAQWASYHSYLCQESIHVITETRSLCYADRNELLIYSD